MRRLLAAVCLAVVLAGCAGGGPATDATAGTATDRQVTGGTDAPAGTQTPTPRATLTDEHPYVEGDRVNATAMLLSHFRVLERAESFTVANNLTAAWAANGTSLGRQVVVNRADIAAERWRLTRRSFGPDGTSRIDETRYANATRSCLVGSETACRDGGFDRRRVLGLTVETTALESLRGPDFRPAGTVTRDGQALYRYTAETFRDPLPEAAASDLGREPALENATVLVAPDGQVALYRVTYTVATDGGRQRGTLTYTTRALNATTVSPPAALR